MVVNWSVADCTPVLIQQNDGESNFFNRSWAEFAAGFGVPGGGNYWLGNDRLSELTLSGRYKLMFELQSLSKNGTWYYAQYSTFTVLSEAYNYTLRVGGYSGNAGNDAFGYIHHDDMMFSTYDVDNDLSSLNCAASRGGGFWYRSCDYAQVNLPRVGGSEPFSWHGLPGGILLQTSRMWLRCK